MLGLSPGIKISNSSKCGHSTFVLPVIDMKNFGDIASTSCFRQSSWNFRIKESSEKVGVGSLKSLGYPRKHWIAVGFFLYVV